MDHGIGAMFERGIDPLGLVDDRLVIRSLKRDSQASIEDMLSYELATG
jgi:hypothetical protein